MLEVTRGTLALWCHDCTLVPIYSIEECSFLKYFLYAFWCLFCPILSISVWSYLCTLCVINDNNQMLEDEGVLWNLSQPFSVLAFYKNHYQNIWLLCKDWPDSPQEQNAKVCWVCWWGGGWGREVILFFLDYLTYWYFAGPTSRGKELSSKCWVGSSPVCLFLELDFLF